ncbi:alpha/beta-hydrolase [Aspergillus sclerotioniger CBS 115572]|uniref:Dipeptidyl-peptidase V n=1 Tax=Aspergillus sclerotioniger CBS 115572 TaxID=1450535 RepID=A0A317XD02_9EURO|nr:alpha/beta-hydrolase [Aspergillus sclerotioniger CBS 115572]PWY96496.1 alpha/beta-hydrolase [Aspergillus sclerotioniger CBS 115572]
MATDLIDTLEVSLEALADLQIPRDLSISPDDTKIAYTLQALSKTGDHATSSIWIAKVGEENSSRRFTSGLFNDEQPQWSPAGTFIAFKSDRHRPGKSTAIYVLPVDGGEAYPITPVDCEKPIAAFEWDSTGTSIAFTSADEKTDEQVAKEKAKDDPTVWGEDLEYLRLRIAHVATRQIETIVCGNRHVHDFSWSPDSRQICFTTHKGPDINSAGFYGAEFWITSISGLESKMIVEFPGPINQIAWGNCGVYFIAGHVPTHCLTSLSLYELELEHGSYAERTDGNEEHCCITLRKNPSCLSYRVQRYLADEFFSISDGTRTKIYSEECEMSSFDVLNTPDSTVIVITKGDGSNPEEVFSVSECAGTVKLWILYYLDGMIYVPSKYKPEDGPLATIVIPHGGPYWRVTAGWSQGGFLSYFAVTREDFHFRGAICGAGVAEWTSMTMTSDAYWFQGEMAGGAPWDVDASTNTNTSHDPTTSPTEKKWISDTNGRRGSALWHMRNVKTPILILHGENDVRVPIEQAIAFYRACIHNNVPVEMVTYPREGHFIVERRHLLDMWDRMRKFCYRNLQ